MGKISSFIKGSDDLSPKMKKYREIILYLICGGLTTVVNLLSFAIFEKLVNATFYVQIFTWKVDLLDALNQFIAWVLAVLVAFITNRLLVFKSNGSVMGELIKFVGSRIATLVIFELGTFVLALMICENVFHIIPADVAFTIFAYEVTNKFIVKIANAIFVVIVNYFLSKVFIFKRDENKAKAKEKA